MTLKKKIYFSIIALAISASLIIAFIIFPLLKEINLGSEELVSQKANAIAIEEKTENLKKLSGIFQAAEPDITKINDLFINAQEPIGFIQFLEKISQESQVESKYSITAYNKDKKDTWPSLDFKIIISGSPANFLKFLEMLENAPYLIAVQNLNVAQMLDKKIIQVTLVFKVYAKD